MGLIERCPLAEGRGYWFAGGGGCRIPCWSQVAIEVRDLQLTSGTTSSEDLVFECPVYLWQSLTVQP
jgi:hypothetical protein